MGLGGAAVGGQGAELGVSGEEMRRISASAAGAVLYQVDPGGGEGAAVVEAIPPTQAVGQDRVREGEGALKVSDAAAGGVLSELPLKVLLRTVSVVTPSPPLMRMPPPPLRTG